MATPAASLSVLVQALGVGRTNAQLGSVQTQLAATGAAGAGMGTRLARGAKVAGLATAGLAAAGVVSFGRFDRAMTNSLAIMGEVSGPMRARMEKAARRVGKTTQFSAEQAGEAYFFLASAGMDAVQALDAMPEVAKFAQAGQFDLATATDLSTDALSALGLKSDDAAENLTNLARVQDILVGANTLANATVEQFATSLTTRAGAALRSVNKDAEEGVAVLAALADQGTKGQRAGNALAIIMRDLQRAAIDQADVFRDANVAVFDNEGNMRNLADIVGDMEGHFDGMSDAQKRAAFSQMGFQDRSLSFMLQLMGTSDAIREYERELRDAGGTTEEIADKQLEGFSGAWIRVRSRVQDAVLAIGEGLAPTLHDLLEILDDDRLDASEKFDAIVDELSGALERAATVVGEVAPRIGAELAGGIARAFTEASPLGKAVIAAGVIRLLGGRGALMGAGALAGRFVVGGMAGSMAAGATAGGAAGGAAAGAAAGGGIAAAARSMIFRVGWIGLGAFAANELIKGFTQDSVVAEWAREIEGAFGALWTNRDVLGLEQFAERADKLAGILESMGDAEGAERVRELGREAELSVPRIEILERALDRIPESFRRATSLGDVRRQWEANLLMFERGTQEWEQANRASFDAVVEQIRRFEEQGRLSAGQAGRAIQQLKETTGIATGDIEGHFEGVSSTAREAFRGTQSSVSDAVEGVRSDMRDMSGGIRQSVREGVRSLTSGTEVMKRAVGSLSPVFDDADQDARRAFAGVSGATRDMNSRSTAHIVDMVGTTSRGIATMARNTNSALEAFGVADRIRFTLNTLDKSQIKPLQDRPPGGQTGGLAAMVPGHSTGDRHTLSLNGRPIARVESREGIFVGNRRMMEAAAEANAAVPRFQRGGFPELQGPARSLANQLLGRGFTPTSTFRASSTTHHGRGEAIDYGDSINPMGPLWSILRPQVARLAELFGPSRLPGPTLWKHGSPFSDAGLQSTHEDHIHVAITSAIGAVGRALEQIRAPRLGGPEGALRNLGQSAMDKVAEAANARLEGAMAATSDFHLGGGPSAGGARAELARIAASRGWNARDWSELVQRESSWDPTARNSSSGAFGLGQFLGATARTYAPHGALSSDPVRQIQAMARYINDRYGNPTAALRFHDQKDWYREGGFVDVWGKGLAHLQAGGPLQAVGGDTRASISRRRAGANPKWTRVGGIRIPPMTHGVPRGALNAIGGLFDQRLPKLEEHYQNLERDFSDRQEFTLRRDAIVDSRGQIVRFLRSGEWPQLLDLPDDQRVQSVEQINQRAVDARVREIAQLMEAKQAIRSALEEARDRLEATLATLRAGIEERQQQMERIRSQVTRNVSRIRQLAGVRGNIVDSYRRAVRGGNTRLADHRRGQFGRVQDAIRTLRGRNVALGGEPTRFGRGGLFGRFAESREAWQRHEGTLSSHLQDVVGHTGRGGKLREAKRNLASLDKERLELDPRALRVDLRGPEPFKVDGRGESARDSELERLLREQLTLERQRRMVSESQFDVLRDFPGGTPFMGAFAKGGVALIGEDGPELVHTPSGSRIHSAGDTERMLSGPRTLVVKNLTIHEDGRVSAEMEDRKVEAIVERVTRKQARRGDRFGGQVVRR